LGIEPGRKVLLVMGGSLGAGAIHRAVAEFIETARRQRDPLWGQLAVVHVAGERQELHQQHGVKEAGGPVQYIPAGYVDGPSMLHASDFYFGRAGSATIGEIAAAGIPALLMPDPQHADRHQFGNAAYLVYRGQGEVLDQHEPGHAPHLATWLRRVWDKPRLPAQQPSAAELAAAAIAEVWQ
jgi:UDP-N-acetylglucosamine--N-acetylmuramyl-(pentapeptide) pyrophosphoryl-undecaprenol N-acetylglucosamine transferase